MEWLGDEVVGAALVPFDCGLAFSTRRKEHYRNVLQRWVLLDGATEVEATSARHHDVGQHQIGTILVD